MCTKTPTMGRASCTLQLELPPAREKQLGAFVCDSDR